MPATRTTRTRFAIVVAILLDSHHVRSGSSVKRTRKKSRYGGCVFIGKTSTLQFPSLAALERQIAGKIAELGGAVLPKLNWSAPRVLD